VSITRGRQRTCPVVAGRRFKRDVWVRRTSPDAGGAGGGELKKAESACVDGLEPACARGSWRRGVVHRRCSSCRAGTAATCLTCQQILTCVVQFTALSILRPEGIMADTIALVTGANKGIGREISRQLSAKGVLVLMGARDRERGESAAAELRAQSR
jgi:short chain dehydrogenase